MVENRSLYTRMNSFMLLNTVWLLMTISVGVSAEISNEVDSDMGSLSLGMGGVNEVTIGQEGGIGNNSVTAVQPGDAARLSCPIPAEMFGTRVSWIRRGDLQLLSVGENVYVQDQRLFVSHSRHSRNSHHSQVWFLHLMNVTKRDEGEYECQMATHPHVSIFTFLKVQNAYSRVEGPEERVVASGSSLRLDCVIKDATSPPSYLFWYHYDRMVNYDASRGISVTQSSPMQSTLMISEVTADHAGNYTCQPSNAAPSSVDVHVVAETTEPSATGRVGKKVSDKTPVRQLGVKSASSGGHSLLSPTVALTLFGLLALHALVVPCLLPFSARPPVAGSYEAGELHGPAAMPKATPSSSVEFSRVFQRTYSSNIGDVALLQGHSHCYCSSGRAQFPNSLPE